MPFMRAPIDLETTKTRPSQVIAEALVERHSPSQITSRAAKLGLPRPLTRAMVIACCATAVDASGQPRRRAAAAT